MEGLDLGQMANPSLAWKKGRFQIHGDDNVDDQTVQNASTLNGFNLQ